MALRKYITEATSSAGVHTLTVSDVTGLYIGWSITVEGAGNNYDGTHTITDIDATALTVEFQQGNQTHPAFEGLAQLYVPVTWIDDTAVIEFLGSADDQDWLDVCVEAANDWAFDRRKAAGYVDIPDAAPSPRASAGTVLYAAALYREKGSVDTFASFSEIPLQPPVGTLGRIKQLLGIERPAVA